MILDDPIKTDVRVCFSSRSRILHPVAAAASTTARPLQAYVVLEKSPSLLRAGNLPLLAAWPPGHSRGFLPSASYSQDYTALEDTITSMITA